MLSGVPFAWLQLHLRFLQEYCVFYVVSQMEFDSVFIFGDFQKKLSSKNVPNFYGLSCVEGYQKSFRMLHWDAKTH